MCYTVMMKRIILAIVFAGHIMPVYAIETAPRISDREIIESLTELKAGQIALEQRFDDRFKALEQRFEALEQRFESRFNMILLAIFGLVGFILWDRRTMMKPLEARLDRIE